MCLLYNLILTPMSNVLFQVGTQKTNDFEQARQ